MNTLILRETTRVLFALILVFSISTLLRGHNTVGGGFVAGLIASIACSLYGFVAEADEVRRLLRAAPLRIAASGLALAVLSGLIGFLADRSPFLSSKWTHIGGQHVGSPLLFDVGVYLVVVGAVLTFVLELRTSSTWVETDSPAGDEG